MATLLVLSFNNSNAVPSSMISHDVVEGAERHDRREAEKNHQLQPLRLDGPVDGLEDLKLVEQPLRLLLEHETAQQERQDAPDRCSGLWSVY